MKHLGLILANFRRKRIRALLTFCSIAVALFLFGLLATIDAALLQGVEVAGVDRLLVRNKTSLIMPLPYSYMERLARFPGVTGVSFAVWFGGIYQDERNFFPQFAVEPESWKEMYPEYEIPAEQWQAFLADREGCVAGRYTAERFGWKIGDRIPIRGSIWTGNWEFNLRAIYDGRRPGDDESQFWFQYDLLEERRPWGKGSVGWYMVRVGDPDQAAGVARAIDGEFANSPWETATETERAFAAGFARQIGNIRLILLSIGGVVFFTLLLVTGNTMAMAVRERTGELAVLKTVGFSDRTVSLLVLAESLGLALAAGGAGLLLAKLFTLQGDPTGGLLPVFFLPPRRVLYGIGLAALVGLLSGILPAAMAMRLRIVDALRRI